MASTTRAPRPPGRTLASPVVLVWALLASILIALIMKATLAAPPGTVFVGTFLFVPDFYIYLSYVQQAQAGAVLLRNKLVDPSFPAVVFNLEWLVVGWLSRLLGNAPIVAYHALGLGALAANVALVDRWLVRAGLPPSRRLAGLLLVFTGGGLGGVLALVASPEVAQTYALDLYAGLYPFLEVIGNPHFVLGTTLLVASLSAFALRRPSWGVLLGTVLALVRPYDAVLVCGVEGLAVVILAPPRAWPRRLLTVAAIFPALAYDLWAFMWAPGSQVFAGDFWKAFQPPATALAVSLGPAVLIAVTVLRLPHSRNDEATRHRLYLGLWFLLAILVEILRPVTFAFQLMAGVGLPLLALGAIGLASFHRRALTIAVPPFACSAVVLTLICAIPQPHVNVPSSRWQVASTLRPLCRPGQVVLAPSDIGSYVGGFTACWPFVSHGAAPGYLKREAALRRFGVSSDAERAAFLERRCIAYFVAPAVWTNGGLPPVAPYHLAGRTTGVEPLAVYARDPASPCPGARAATAGP